MTVAVAFFVATAGGARDFCPGTVGAVTTREPCPWQLVGGEARDAAQHPVTHSMTLGNTEVSSP